VPDLPNLIVALNKKIKPTKFEKNPYAKLLKKSSQKFKPFPHRFKVRKILPHFLITPHFPKPPKDKAPIVNIVPS